MYKSVKWSPQSPLSSASMSQMVNNDKENYGAVSASAGPVLALSVMRNNFETMPGNNPVNITDLSIDTFRAPYTGWYKAHFSCQAARQSVTTDTPIAPTAAASHSLVDGFHFAITYKQSSKPPTKYTYNNITGASTTITQTSGLDPYIGHVVSRSCFVMSGATVPVASTGYKWFSAGDTVSWYVYVYVADNSRDDFYGSTDRNYGKISMNTIQSSDGMGQGAPRTYLTGTSNGVSATAPIATAGTNDGLLDKALITSLVSPSDTPLRCSFLMVQYAGSGGVPGMSLSDPMENALGDRLRSPNGLSDGYAVLDPLEFTG